MRQQQVSKHLITVPVDGDKVYKALKSQIAERTGIQIDKILAVRVLVSDDFTGISDYDADDSFVELARGVRIQLKKADVMHAARETCSGIPGEFQVIGLGFPHQEVSGDVSCLDAMKVNCVLARDPASLPVEELPSLLGDICQCRSCNSHYFWNPGCLGEAVVDRLFESTVGRQMLTELITNYVDEGGTNVCMSLEFTLRGSDLRDVGLYLVANKSDALRDEHCQDIVSAFLGKPEMSTPRLAERLQELLSPDATVQNFLSCLSTLKDNECWSELKELVDSSPYGKAIQRVLRFAKQRGFKISKPAWEASMRTKIRSLSSQHDGTIRMLSEPPEQHSERLRTWVLEVCDHEGDPTWSEEQDYDFRVQHVLESLASESHAAMPDFLRDCSEKQLEGKGWLPCRFGLFCMTGGARTLLAWSQVLTETSSRPASEVTAPTEVTCKHCNSSFRIPNWPSDLSARVAALVRSSAGRSPYPMEAIAMLRRSSDLHLGECKVIAEHVTRSIGLCHSCGEQLQASGHVVCPKCHATNLDW